MKFLQNLPISVLLIGIALLAQAETEEPETASPESLATKSHDSHWAFQPLQDVASPPAIDQWSNHPIDRFVARAWRERNLLPVAQADPQVLLR